MKPQTAEFPPRPLPHFPQPQQPDRPHVQPPTVFVYERRGWEYRVVTRNADEHALTEDELNVLGKEGWELVGVVPTAGVAQFYFKRMCD
jgi:hypothetical protein